MATSTPNPVNATSLVALAAALVSSVLASAKVGGVPAEVVADLEAALASLIKVQGTDVTFSQLEALRVKTQW